METLLGENNPGGELPLTFPRHVGQVPIYYNHKPSAGRSNWWVNYATGRRVDKGVNVMSWMRQGFWPQLFTRFRHCC